jgi:epoxyqueuosine reductase QueG
MSEDLKQDLVDRLKQVGAFDVRVADPKIGFEHALPGKHPLELWPGCRSVIVIAVARSPKANNIYFGPYAPWSGERQSGPLPRYFQSDKHAMVRLSNMFSAFVRLEAITFLLARGYNISTLQPQSKLSAVEAGISVYGRSGITINPVLGNRMVLATIMTDAVLQPDGRLEGFDPCDGCDACVRLCPAEAYEPAKRYPDSWSREKCTTKRAEIEEREVYCHNCFAICPAGGIDDDELFCREEAKSFFKP